ncbi:ENDO1 [Symbiodinium natans]|uniref:ENDO1 protein n=1 Tax=Symbiodinium natans TaxID=878477 RepID=A0A812V7V0_9DINO|nr:ENDO1 [Symbiodinium natans]
MLLIFLLPAVANAWWDNGHLLVAEVARQQLTPQQVAHINDILKDFADDYPGTSDLVTAAVWPDMLKCSSQSTICPREVLDNIHIFDSWHYNEKPYNPDGVKLPICSDKWQNNPSALYTMTSAMLSLGSNSRFTHNFFLRWMLHVVGDIHQPLHTVSGFFDNPQLGKLTYGDLGGNRIPVQSPCGTSNLHAYWDSAACTYLINWSPDLDRRELSANATALTSKYPKTSSVFAGRYIEDDLQDCWTAVLAGRAAKPFDVCQEVFLSWTDDTYDSGVAKAYTGITSNSSVPADYAAWAKEFSEQQIVLGGYRLGGLLRLVASRVVLPSPGEKNKKPPPEWTLTAKLFAALSLILVILLACLLNSTLKLRRKLVNLAMTEGLSPRAIDPQA